MEDMRSLPVVDELVRKENFDTEVLEQTEIQIKYAGYIQKEKNNADKLTRLEGVKIPENIELKFPERYIPALLINTSIFFQSSDKEAKEDWTWPKSRTSKIKIVESTEISFCKDSRRSFLLPHKINLYPFSAKTKAVSRPIPELAPVIHAIFSITKYFNEGNV